MGFVTSAWIEEAEVESLAERSRRQSSRVATAVASNRPPHGPWRPGALRKVPAAGGVGYQMWGFCLFVGQASAAPEWLQLGKATNSTPISTGER